MNVYIKVGLTAVAAGYSTVMGVLTAKAVKDLLRKKNCKVEVEVDNRDIEDQEVADAE